MLTPPRGAQRWAQRPEPPEGHHPALRLPERYELLDLTRGYTPPTGPYSVGRYDEDRAGLYTAALFGGARTLHMGIDLGAPAGAEVFAFREGRVYAQGALPAPGDYGHTVITEHEWRGAPLWALYGHLSAASIEHLKVGQRVERGQRLGWLGEPHENGGWPPHLHFQLSLHPPRGHDLPGVVAPSERAEALRLYPDPRLVLGELYT
jgi:murein DD-endopeptidase MepM/ murein hydrolase activator NlpD